MSLVTVLIIFLLLSVVYSAAMHGRTWPYNNWSPLGFMLLLLLTLFLAGHLR